MGVSVAIEAADQIDDREWFTAAELADLRLPGLPADKRSLNRRARDERWQYRTDSSGSPLCRPRLGRGGGTEFYVSLLPGTARLELARRGIGAQPAPAEIETAANGSWRWYDVQSQKVKDVAQERLAVVAEIHLLKESGATGTAAVAECARRHVTSTATLWNWMKLVQGVSRADWLPALAPRRKGGGCEADIDPMLWKLFLSDYLRPEQPTLTSCYARTAAVAAQSGLSLPSEKTIRRRLESETGRNVIMLRRQGDEAVRRSLPSQRRSVAELHALEWVNIDGHKFDVFVKSPIDGKPIRPMMVAIQDIYSRKFLAWRLGESESAVLTRLAFADLFEAYGIPQHCVLDNGRAFASKWITGGAKSRFRFKIKAEEPTGVLTALGIAIHWALPFRGQSKPIERGFRDLCDTVARHPAVAGAYTGNNPMAKPENYGSKAIDWAEFVAHVDRGMAAHNAKLGRRTETGRGRSFDEVFAESYATAPIGKASPEQLRMALLAAEMKRLDKRTGEIELAGNRYWSEGCSQHHGDLVTVRFDPDNLHREIHLYGQDGRYLTSAQLIADTGFGDSASARTWAKQQSDLRRRVRDGADAEQLLDAATVARMQADTPTAPVPAPSVHRMVRHRGQTAAALKAVRSAEAQQQETLGQFGKAMAGLRLVE